MHLDTHLGAITIKWTKGDEGLKIGVLFVVIFTFSSKGFLGWNILQYVTKNIYIFQCHIFCIKIFMNNFFF
jgi:hypothetical protein